MVGTAAAMMAILAICSCGTGARVSQQLPTVSESTATSVATPSPSAMKTTQPGSSVSATSTPSSAPTIEVVPAPADTNARFTIQFKTRQKVNIPRDVPEVVHGLDVPSGQVIQPSEPSGSNWSNTSVWVKEAPYPQLPAVGRTVVGGHSCHHHTCPFSAIQQNPDGSFTVSPHDTIIVTTPSGVLTYQVCRVGLSPKNSPALVIPGCGTTPIDLVVGTCHYEQGDTSNFNIVISATLIGGKKV